MTRSAAAMALYAASGSADPQVRKRSLRDPAIYTRTVAALLRALDDPAEEVRYGAAGACGALGIVEAIPTLRRLAASDTGVCLSHTVAEVAATALQSLEALQT